jgi:hypothetical protein
LINLQTRGHLLFVHREMTFLGKLEEKFEKTLFNDPAVPPPPAG